MLSPSLVILSGAKDPGIWLRVNSAKHLLLIRWKNRFFAEFTLSEAEGLSMMSGRMFARKLRIQVLAMRVSHFRNLALSGPG